MESVLANILREKKKKNYYPWLIVVQLSEPIHWQHFMKRLKLSEKHGLTPADFTKMSTV